MTVDEVTEEFLRSVDVHTVLPQQEPFVMIGNLTHFELNSSTTETLVDASNLFVDSGFLSPCGMMENIAQTCAARVGFYNTYIVHNDVQIGYIGAIRNYTIFGKAPVGSRIETTVDVVEEVFGMTLAKAKVNCQGKTIATAEIKLAVKNVQ